MSFEETSTTVLDGSKRRAQQIADIIQDVIIAFFLALILGSLIEALFFPENLEDVKKHSTIGLILLVITQLILNAMAIFYIALIISTLPKVVHVYPQYSGTDAARAASTAVIGLVFVGCQFSLIARINELVRRFRI